MRIRRVHAVQWLSALAAIVLVAMAGVTLPWSHLWESTRHASLSLLGLALAASALAIGARTVIWWLFLRVAGARSIAGAARAMIVGLALQCVLIGNAGEAGRVMVVVRESRMAASAVIATVVLERLLVMAGFLVTLLAVGTVMTLPASLARGRIPVIAALCIAGALLTLLARSVQAHDPDAESHSSLHRVRRAARLFLLTVRQAASPRRLSAAMSLAAANWMLQIVAIHATALAVSYPISIAGSVVALLAVSIGGSVRATPGNVGVTQLAYAGTAAAIGLPVTEALGVALLLQLVQTAPVLLAGAALLAASVSRSLWRMRLCRHICAATTARTAGHLRG